MDWFHCVTVVIVGVWFMLYRVVILLPGDDPYE